MQTENMPHDFLMTLIIATFMVGITVVVHFFGLAILMRILRGRGDDGVVLKPHVAQRMFTILFVIFGLFAVHSIEIWSYAALYHYVLGAIGDFETALYYSTVSFVSLGYGDVVLAKKWRLIGAIEAANGVILLGWSTAFLVTVIGRLQVLEHEWLDK
jgi:F0F1-type ATP synthase membrane subunit c/vacuolar-type H+-ATPase subunit K